MRLFPLSSRRRSVLGQIAERVLEAPDLPSLTRLLTRDLPQALEAHDATLLLWDRRLESFEGIALAEGGGLRTFRPEATEPEGPKTRWLLSEGQLLETSPDARQGMLVPLLARSGLAGMLVLGEAPGRRRPLQGPEVRLVSLIATRAALAVENHSYQKELIASERLAALGTMAGMLVHDYRGPLTLIRGWAETLCDGELPPDEVGERARAIVEAVDRLERMTTETLDFARGAERLVLRSVPVRLLLEEIAAGIESELPGLSVEREFSLPAGLRGSLDVDKIRRAVTNVAANARDAMGGAGRMVFSGRLATLDSGDGPAPHLVLELADEGPGVSREIREHVFEPFVTMGKKRGTGLGLAVARRFVEDHGGGIELDPEPAPGARFRITLPLALAPAR